MQLEATVLISAGLAIVGYAAKSYLDLRLKSVEEYHKEKCGAVHTIREHLAEVDHCVMHLRNGVEHEYPEKLRAQCATARKHSRAAGSFVGEDLITQVREATDAALAFVESRSEDDAIEWLKGHGKVLDAFDVITSKVDLRPRMGRPRQTST